jgi:adenosylcobyric acid synthase
MLGKTIADPEGIEGRRGAVAGLGLLDVETIIGGDKTVVAVTGTHVPTGELIAGYEIHLGQTHGIDCVRPVVDLDGRLDGAQSGDGRVFGTYVHGLFAGDGYRRAFLRSLGAVASDIRYEANVDAVLDELAEHLERYVDIDRLLAIAADR